MAETIHVMPVNDLVSHIDHEDCPCVPECRPVETDDGGINWLCVHYAWDGRD